MKHKTLADNGRYVATPASNSFLGECISVGYFLDAVEEQIAGITGDSVIFLVKTNVPVLPIKTGERSVLFNESLFLRPSRVPLRIMSACITGILGDSSCDCHTDMVEYLAKIAEYKEGVFVYLPQEGMGRGLRNKLSDHRLQKGIDATGVAIPPVDFKTAVEEIIPNEEFDIRSYHFLQESFRDLGLTNLSYNWLGNEDRSLLFATQTGVSISCTNKQYEDY